MCKKILTWLTQETIKIFIGEIFSEPPKKIYATSKTDVYRVDAIWSLDTLTLKDYGPEIIEDIDMF